MHDGDPETYNSEVFTLNGNSSFDPDGDNIVTYIWKDSQFQVISENAYYEGSIDSPNIDDVLGDHEFLLEGHGYGRSWLYPSGA